MNDQASAPRAILRSDYEDYLRRQRGLSERTIFHCWRFADRFLDFRFDEEGEDLSAITPDDIARFMQHLTMRRRAPFRDRTPPTHLRNFFRYLFKAGQTPTNLALGMLSIKRQYGARLPRYLADDHVERLLEAVRSASPKRLRCRNYAMVLLQARLGLRALEVVAMQLDDIDWRAGEIIVRGKGRRHDRLPLQPEVGAALADYIRHDRPAAPWRTLFVRDRAPHGPFKDGQVLNNILRAAFAKTGVKPPAPYVGSHVLRHSLAAHMARAGASLEEIGDLLRHRSRSSTTIYARLDIDGLRSVAQSWPVAGGERLPHLRRDRASEHGAQSQHSAGGDPFLLPVRRHERTRAPIPLPEDFGDARQTIRPALRRVLRPRRDGGLGRGARPLDMDRAP